MRIDADDHLIYANPASDRVRQGDRRRGRSTDRRPRSSARFDAVAPDARLRRVRVDEPDLRGLARPDPRPELHEPLRNGRDRRASDREVPGPEPEPGLPDPTRRGSSSTPTRASAGIVAGLGLALGSALPADLADALLERARAADGSTDRGRGGRSRLRPAAGRRPRVRLHQRLRHRRHGREGDASASRARTSDSC